MNDETRKKIVWALGATGGLLSILWKIVPLLWGIAMFEQNHINANLNERMWRLEHPGTQGPPPDPRGYDAGQHEDPPKR